MSDPLSSILRLTQARSVMAGGIKASGRWALRFPPPGEIKFAVLAKGSCWMRLDGHKKALRGEEGDVLLMPGRRGFVVGSDLSLPPEDVSRLIAKKRGPLAIIGDGSECVTLAGGVTLDPANADFVRDALPPLIRLRASAPHAAAARWIVEQLFAEQTRASGLGAEAAASTLAQLLFVQVLRAHLATAPRLPAGWLRAACDERLSRALRCIHDEPARDWKLEELAKAAAMSRTTFAVRFREAAGVAPLQYLAAWRVRLAQRRLREEAVTLAELAADLGYASEGAFSQAFKRIAGVPPRAYRQAERAL